MKYFISLTALFFGLSIHAQNTTKVTIQQEGFEKKHQLRVMINNLLVEINEQGKLLFEKEMEIEGPIFGMVINKNSMYTGFWLEPGYGKVIIKKQGFPGSTKVPGSSSHEVYQSLYFAPDNSAFIQSFVKNIDNPIALDVFNSTFKFKKFEQQELQDMVDAVAQEDKGAVSDVHAYLKTFGLEKVKIDGQIVDFKGEDQNGNSFSTEEYRGKYLLLDFAATNCGPCWTGYPDMVEQASKYENLQVLTYNEDAAIESWNKIAKDKGIVLPWPVLWKGEDKLEVFERYNVEGWPLHFIISPEGKVLETWFGSGKSTLANNLKKHVK